MSYNKVRVTEEQYNKVLPLLNSKGIEMRAYAYEILRAMRAFDEVGYTYIRPDGSGYQIRWATNDTQMTVLPFEEYMNRMAEGMSPMRAFEN